MGAAVSRFSNSRLQAAGSTSARHRRLDVLLRALRVKLGAERTETKIVLRSGPPKPTESRLELR